MYQEFIDKMLKDDKTVNSDKLQTNSRHGPHHLEQLQAVHLYLLRESVALETFISQFRFSFTTFKAFYKR